MARIRNMAELDDKLHELEAINESIEALQKKADKLKDDIKKFMGCREHLETPNYKVNFTFVRSTHFDVKNFREDHPSLYELYSDLTESRRFSFK